MICLSTKRKEENKHGTFRRNLDKRQLKQCIQKVYQNKGASGADDISVYEIKEYIQNNSDEILNPIRKGI